MLFREEVFLASDFPQFELGRCIFQLTESFQPHYGPGVD
jgi:hypothetical protein